MPGTKGRILAYFQSLTEITAGRAGVAGGVFATAMLGMVAASAIAPSQLPGDPALVVETLSAPAVVLNPADAAGFLHEDRVQKNDTLASLLARLGVTDAASIAFLRSHPSTAAIARQMRPGKPVSAYTDGDGQLIRLHFPLNGPNDRFLVVSRTDKGFVAAEEALAPQREIVLKSGQINVSLFAATDAAGIPDGIATQLAEVFSGDIDFHRDLRKGDSFAVSYEVLRVRGQVVRSGRILAAEFVNAGKTLGAVYFANGEGDGGYYDTDGKSLRKAFLRSPLEFSRVTSGFSNARYHPVLKEWRAHRGIDYGAPTGTRVRATGDGTVEIAGRQGGYGNLVILRHPGGFSTVYGHLNGFAPGLHKGARIRQGDLIGFVGQTGLATGPHLHYEFRVREQQVNPLAIQLPEAPPLNANSLTAFKPFARDAVSRLALARSTTAVLME